MPGVDDEATESQRTSEAIRALSCDDYISHAGSWAVGILVVGSDYVYYVHEDSDLVGHRSVLVGGKMETGDTAVD